MNLYRSIATRLAYSCRPSSLLPSFMATSAARAPRAAQQRQRPCAHVQQLAVARPLFSCANWGRSEATEWEGHGLAWCGQARLDLSRLASAGTMPRAMCAPAGRCEASVPRCTCRHVQALRSARETECSKLHLEQHRHCTVMPQGRSRAAQLGHHTWARNTRAPGRGPHPGAPRTRPAGIHPGPAPGGGTARDPATAVASPCAPLPLWIPGGHPRWLVRLHQVAGLRGLVRQSDKGSLLPFRTTPKGSDKRTGSWQVGHEPATVA